MADVEASRGGAAGKRRGGVTHGYGEQRGWTPWLVPLILVACVAVFVVEMYVNNCPAHSQAYGSCSARFLHRFSFQPVRQNPLLGPSALEKMGALQWSKVVHQHQAWRLVTCIWMTKISLSLSFAARIGSIYLLSGIGGALLSALLLRNGISVGASGSLFGLLGAMAAALSILIVIVAINLGIGLFPHVDNFAHIGGFLSGFLLGFLGENSSSLFLVVDHVLDGLTLRASFFCRFVVGLVMLFTGVNGNDRCHWVEGNIEAELQEDVTLRMSSYSEVKP
ncbi:hypothetical protein ZIOFF_072746 [Zingiber officinale]|uniref:RHOMBOID-like protein n=1 Tax=Zingiber officinale TaxID=94328 RepID=A0A8J5C692_ZINOF|nr:hypothetical protein ZIOFF_072746 [Zingiber officinale]